MKDNNWKMLAVAGFAALGGVMWGQVIAPRDAVGYPSGAAVSHGGNPIFSEGGTLSLSSGVASTTWSSVSGQDAVITDVVLSAADTNGSCSLIANVSLSDSSSTLAEFVVSLPKIYEVGAAAPPAIAFNSGIRLEDGDTLTITSTPLYTHSSSCVTPDIYYTITGYYAEP